MDDTILDDIVTDDDTIPPNHAHVTVDDDGTVHCKPDPLPAAGRDIHLKFVLKTEGYVFPDDDAVVLNEPCNEFPVPSKTLPPGNTTVHLFDRNTGPGSYDYTVTVVKLLTGECLKHDPTIDNGP